MQHETPAAGRDAPPPRNVKRQIEGYATYVLQPLPHGLHRWDMVPGTFDTDQPTAERNAHLAAKGLDSNNVVFAQAVETLH